MTTTSFDELLRERPIDPEEMEARKAEIRQYARAYKLREMREAQAMTQAQVAQELGVGQNRVSQIELGKIGHSQVDTLKRYVEALGGRLTVEAEFGDNRYVIAG